MRRVRVKIRRITIQMKLKLTKTQLLHSKYLRCVDVHVQFCPPEDKCNIHCTGIPSTIGSLCAMQTGYPTCRLPGVLPCTCSKF